MTNNKQTAFEKFKRGQPTVRTLVKSVLGGLTQNSFIERPSLIRNANHVMILIVTMVTGSMSQIFHEGCLPVDEGERKAFWVKRMFQYLCNASTDL